VLGIPDAGTTPGIIAPNLLAFFCFEEFQLQLYLISIGNYLSLILKPSVDGVKARLSQGESGNADNPVRFMIQQEFDIQSGNLTKL
jgi:hypothetical protein